MIHDNSEEEGRRYCQLRSGDASADPLPRFHYEPLEPRCIRILELQPGLRSDPFQGKFIIANVDSDFVYDALSYMWGDATQTDRVVVGGATIPTAWNLTRALEYLRDFARPEPLRIWIDAISINQRNIEEQAEQVAMMRTIYHNASCVRIWINEPSLDEESAAVAALKSFKFNPKAEFCGLDDDPSFWDHLVPMFNNGYWNRIWIRQEVLNARKLRLHCMNVTLDGIAASSFQEAIDHVFHKYSRNHISKWSYNTLVKLRGPVARPIGTEMFAVHGRQTLRYRLIDILLTSSKMKVLKGQDRLYALMHLAEDYEEGRIMVNYNKTVEQVMADAAAYHISQHQNLDFLDMSFRRKETSNPTWIPQSWMGHRSGRSKLSRYVGHGPEHFEHTQCSLESVDIRNLRLCIRGMNVGSVRQCIFFDANTSTAEMTVAGFWKSSLGEYILPYLRDTDTGLPQDFSWAIRGGIFGRNHDHEFIQAGLSYLWEIGKTPEQASRVLGYAGDNILDLLAPLKNSNEPAWAALRDVLRSLHYRSCIITDSQHIGLIPECNIREDDDIWIVLGSSRSVIVRRQASGRYWHICTAYIPALVEHERMAHFSNKIQPGDQIGEWTVEDIELE